MYAVHYSIFSISSKGTAAHRGACDTLWASGGAQTHTSTLFFVSYVSLPGDDVLSWPLSCPFLLSFPAIFFSEIVSVLICFGSVYLVTTIVIVADQLM